MKRFLIKTMGCKSNQLEGVLIEENLVQNGFSKAEKIADADFFILNSCTVTHKSDNEAFQILSHTKKQNPQVTTVLTGCIAQIEKERLLENPNIDIVLGNDEKLEISKYLYQVAVNLSPHPNPPPLGREGIARKSKSCTEGNSILERRTEKFFVNEIENLNSFHQVLLQDTSKTRASLKIQDGCDHRCSYCIIPFARGKNRSADLDFILEQIKIYENAGFKEIMLTGIHIGQYQPSLLKLLKEIETQTKIERFRLGSLNPLEINDEMLEFLKNSEKFCPHFHLSLQSMCDKTLKSMNRHYSARRALDLIEQISEIFPLGFIGSDIIAGFAGESEEDFQTTAENLKKSKLTQIHTFPYSVRKGTAAEKLEGHLPQKIKDERAKVIKKISAQKFSEFLNKNLNSIQEILIEKNLDKKTGMFKGVSRNYINILIKPEGDFDDIRNTIQKVKIESINPVVVGSIVE
jgi:threonylcarbamoyladenosine tRNA methylthiotransferase MtaB